MSMIVEISECRWVFTAGGNYLDMAEMGITLSILNFSHHNGGIYADEESFGVYVLWKKSQLEAIPMCAF